MTTLSETEKIYSPISFINLPFEHVSSLTLGLLRSYLLAALKSTNRDIRAGETTDALRALRTLLSDIIRIIDSEMATRDDVAGVRS